MTFERAISNGPAKQAGDGATVRLAREDDLPALRVIAAVSHHDTRFYFDGHFDRTRCDQLYETWIEKNLHGFANAVLVAELDKKPVGYVTLNSRGTESQIGLIAIAAGHQGTGLGRLLVEHSLNWARQAGAQVMKVVTQGRNVPAQRLYQRCGFVTASFELWYHRWFAR
jgi:GNAT superfamily N-acetyltransferase